MKKLLILGASRYQVPLIDAARQLGFYTIAASIPGDYPGFLIADECCFADISKPDEILFQAKKHQIDGITTCGMDTGVRSMGRVCDAMGLAGINEKAAQTATDKALSKERFQKAGVRCAKSFRISSLKDLENALESLTFPMVLKAVDLMGSRGIYRCASEDEARKAFEEIFTESAQDYCLAEEFLDGLLFGAEGMVSGGKLDFLLPYGTEVYHGAFVPTSLGHWAPLEQTECYEEIEQTVLQALDALGIQTSPFNCDLISKDGHVFLIEINPRAGASFLSESVGISYGVNYYELLCRQAMGESVKDFFDLKGNPPCASASHMIISEKTGILKNLKTDVLSDNRIEKLDLFVKAGDPVRAYQNGRDTAGFVIVKGESAQICREHLKEILPKIVLDVE